MRTMSGRCSSGPSLDLLGKGSDHLIHSVRYVFSADCRIVRILEKVKILKFILEEINLREI